MNKKPSFIRQAKVLIDRYFHIFFNDKQNLILTIAIPLFTILSVCMVATPDMYSVKPEREESEQIINGGLPVLKWELVTQEKKNEDKEDKDDPDTVEIEAAEIIKSSWDGETISAPMGTSKIDGEHYFMITDAEQLAFLGKAADYEDYHDYLTYNYILQVDVDFKGYEIQPIGTKEVPFTGTFDGNAHTIRNFIINEEEDNVGLFGYVKSNEKAKTTVEINEQKLIFKHNGIIKNFKVKNATVTSKGNNTAVIVGSVDKTARVTSVCTIGGSVTSNGSNVGAIAGRAVSPDVEIFTCYSTTNITAKGKNVGGVVGNLGSAKLSAAYASSQVKHKGNKDAENYGAVVGQCNDYETQLKSLFYNEDKRDKNKDDDEDSKKTVGFYAVNDKDYKKIAVGLEEDVLDDYSSMLVPFKGKGLYTAHELYAPDHKNYKSIKNDIEKFDDKDYDAEKDDDIDPVHGFKKDGQLSQFTGTQLGLFTLVCVAIFIGVCNSIQEIFKERNILKREYMTNLRLGPYVVSKLVVQAAVCAVQMVVVVAMYALFVGGKKLPDSGVIFGSIWIEYYVTLFILAFAADVLALVVSAVVKSSATANTFIPIILIVQIAFSGVMFELNGVMDFVANAMLSKWGIAALAVTTRLNDAQELFIIENPSLQLQLGSSTNTVNTLFTSTASNLLMIWGILFIFIIVCSFACCLLLTRVKNDRR